jgi:hypothetical protein
MGENGDEQDPEGYELEEPISQNYIEAGEGGEEDEDEDVIDIDNPEDLARRGLKRVQIEGDNEEYLLDGEGNIYNL